MEWDSEVVSHGPRHEEGARNFNGFGDIFGDGDGDGRNPSTFDRALNQSDGLMADGSSRCEQRYIRALVITDGASDFTSHAALESFWIHGVTDEAEEVCGERADEAVFGQLLKSHNRKDDIDVDIGIIMRIFQLVNDQFIRARTRRNAAETEVTKGVAYVHGQIGS